MCNAAEAGSYASLAVQNPQSITFRSELAWHRLSFQCHRRHSLGALSLLHLRRARSSSVSCDPPTFPPSCCPSHLRRAQASQSWGAVPIAPEAGPVFVSASCAPPTFPHFRRPVAPSHLRRAQCHLRRARSSCMSRSLRLRFSQVSTEAGPYTSARLRTTQDFRARLS